MEDDNSPEKASPPNLRPPLIPLSPPLEMSPSKESTHPLDVTEVSGIGAAGPCADTPNRSRRGEGRARNHVRGYMDHSMESSSNVKRTPPGSPVRTRFTHGLASTPNQSFPRIHSHTLAGNPVSTSHPVDQFMSFNRTMQGSSTELDDDEGRKFFWTTSSGLLKCPALANAIMRNSARLHHGHGHFMNRYDLA